MKVQVNQYLSPKQRSEFGQKKNTRRSGRMSLRTRLKELVALILS